MGWKSFFGLGRSKQQRSDSSQTQGQIPAVGRVDAADNRWGVPLLAVHTVTQSMTSTSSNPISAMNAMSFRQDDGASFIGQTPPSTRTIPVDLTYRTDGPLVDGALFLPQVMEHKWALYYHRNQVLCVRSWQRKVLVTASVQNADDYVRVTSVQGVFHDDNEPPELTTRILDFLLRSHALNLPYPAPVPTEMAQDPMKAAMWCVSMYGNRALFATAEALPEISPPEQPLRTYSLLHIAAARADTKAMAEMLSQGISADLPDRDGQPPLHWALTSQTLAAATYLLEHGAQVDFRDPEGATMLMQVVQQAEKSQAIFLLNNHADPNARDANGFTALHRAAYLGHRELVEILLQHGADPNVESQGHTPRSHAAAQGHQAIVRLLDSHNQA